MDAMGKLKKIVEKEFPDFMAVSSIAEGHDYDVLDVFCVDSKWRWRRIPLLKHLKSTLRHVGSLTHKTKRQAHVIQTLVDRAKERPFYIFDQVTYMENQTIDGAIQVNTKYFCEAHGRKSCNCEVLLNLGRITKKRLIYEDIARELKKLKSFTDDFIRLSKNKHLFIIYEVIYAERLDMLSSEYSSLDAGGEMQDDQRADEEPSDMNKNVSKPPLAKGQLTSEYGTLLSAGRPAEMGRFPIAFKCGRVRVVNGKGKTKMLKLSRMDRFYKPFDPTDKRWEKPTCDDFDSPPSSLEH